MVSLGMDCKHYFPPSLEFIIVSLFSFTSLLLLLLFLISQFSRTLYLQTLLLFKKLKGEFPGFEPSEDFCLDASKLLPSVLVVLCVCARLLP